MTGPQCTVDWKYMKSTCRVLGHLLQSPLICLLCTAPFVRALRCAHLFAPSLTHSLWSPWKECFCLKIECVDFIKFQPTVQWYRIRKVVVSTPQWVESVKSTHRPWTRPLAYSLAPLTPLLASHCPLARALRCAHSLARLLTHLLPRSWERGFCLWN